MSQSAAYKPTHGGYPTSTIDRLSRHIAADVAADNATVENPPLVTLGYPIGIVAWDGDGRTVYGVENIATGLALCYLDPRSGPIRRGWYTADLAERFCRRAVQSDNDPIVWAHVPHTKKPALV